MDENQISQPEILQPSQTVRLLEGDCGLRVAQKSIYSFFSDESCEAEETAKLAKARSTQGSILSWLQHHSSRSGKKEEHCGPEVRRRTGWARSLDYFMSLAALVINLETMWSFPAVVGQKMGWTPIIPYLLTMALIGVPMMFLEASLGQFCSQNAIRCWDLAPLFRGVGVAAVINAFWWCWYYSLMQAIAQFYIFNSVTVPLPWKTCMNTWNTNKCYSTILTQCTDKKPGNDGVCYLDDKFEGIWNLSLFAASSNRSRYIISSLEYWENHVWNCPSNAKPDLLTTFNYSLMGCLFVTWLVIFLILMIGILSATKVLYFTVVFSYVTLFIMLINGLLQPGAAKGLRILFRPELDLLLEPETWRHVMMHTVHDLGIGIGTIITLSSYTPFHYNTLRDLVIVVIIKDVTSIVWCIIIFSYLGNILETMNLSFTDLQSEFNGLNNIVVLAHGVSSIRRSRFWSILLFFSLSLWCFNPVAEMMQTAIVAVVNDQCLLSKWRHVLLFFACVVGFCTCLPFTSSCAIDWIANFALNSIGTPVLYTIVIELLVIVGVYGARRFKNDVEVMRQRPISVYWTFAWTFANPILLTSLLMWTLVLTIIHYKSVYVFDVIVIISPLLGFLITMVVQVANEGTADTIRQKLQALVRPKVTWGPFHVHHRKQVKHVKDLVVDPWANEQREGLQQPATSTMNRQSTDSQQPEVLIHSPSGHQLVLCANHEEDWNLEAEFCPGQLY